jgi:hypothetical protein
MEKMSRSQKRRLTIQTPIGGRRDKAPPGECAYCDRERAAGVSFHPPHDASEYCNSGKQPHCSCDACF